MRAYCGACTKKIHPQNMEGAKCFVEANQEEKKRFFCFRERMLAAYRAGDRSTRNLGDPAKQQIVKSHVFSIDSKTRGTIKLLECYPYGDPATNGLGHQVTRAKWKDGTWRDVVLIPNTPADGRRQRIVVFAVVRCSV